MFELSKLIEPSLPVAAFYMTARTCQFVSAPLNLPVVCAHHNRSLSEVRSHLESRRSNHPPTLIGFRLAERASVPMSSIEEFHARESD